MSTSIADRVSAALRLDGRTQRDLARQVGMPTDALSRALNGQRSFSAIELARVAAALSADVHQLITGEPDPQRLVLAARHTYDRETKTHSNESEAADRLELENIALAYRQAFLAPVTDIPNSLAATKKALGPNFTRPFIDRLESIQIGVVRSQNLKTAYSLWIQDRPVIAIPAQGNWFRENWDIAHELGHFVLGHRSVIAPADKPSGEESAAQRFAADLLLPEEDMRAIKWSCITDADLASHVWDLGVSTKALELRLRTLGLEYTKSLLSYSQTSTQKLLRDHLVTDPTNGDQITLRMDDAAKRRFPVDLQNEHLRLIEMGRVGKDTLAWMLDVDVDTLEVAEPNLCAPANGASQVLDDILG